MALARKMPLEIGEFADRNETGESAMARCISFEEARKRRELYGRPLRRRIRSNPPQTFKRFPRDAVAKPTIRANRSFGWAAMMDAGNEIGRMLLSLLLGRKRKPGSPHAPASGAGPLAS